MTLEQYLKLDDEHYISAKNAQLLNRDLATKSVSDIPRSHHILVLDYLVTALNTESVEHEIRANLDNLVIELRKHGLSPEE